MSVYYVKYRWGDDEWRVDNTFSTLESAESYIKLQVAQAQAGVAGSLDGYSYDDFVISANAKGE